MAADRDDRRRVLARYGLEDLKDVAAEEYPPGSSNWGVRIHSAHDSKILDLETADKIAADLRRVDEAKDAKRVERVVTAARRNMGAFTRPA